MALRGNHRSRQERRSGTPRDILIHAALSRSAAAGLPARLDRSGFEATALVEPEV
jgi:hypothetical protein